MKPKMIAIVFLQYFYKYLLTLFLHIFVITISIDKDKEQGGSTEKNPVLGRFRMKYHGTIFEKCLDIFTDHDP